MGLVLLLPQKKRPFVLEVTLPVGHFVLLKLESTGERVTVLALVRSL